MNKTPHKPRLDAFRGALVAERDRLLQALPTPSPSPPERVADDDTPPLAHEEFIGSQLESIEIQRLQLVENALLRLREGTFGHCAGCGRPIPRARLEALPWAASCVPCQQQSADEDRVGHIPLAA
jgi:DnaK suppressor protein